MSPEDLLVYYMKLAWRNAGLHWDSDNEAEVRDIVQGIYIEVDRRIERAVVEATDPRLFDHSGRN